MSNSLSTTNFEEKHHQMINDVDFEKHLLVIRDAWEKLVCRHLTRYTDALIRQDESLNTMLNEDDF